MNNSYKNFGIFDLIVTESLFSNIYFNVSCAMFKQIKYITSISFNLRKNYAMLAWYDATLIQCFE